MHFSELLVVKFLKKRFATVLVVYSDIDDDTHIFGLNLNISSI